MLSVKVNNQAIANRKSFFSKPAPRVGASHAGKRSESVAVDRRDLLLLGLVAPLVTSAPALANEVITTPEGKVELMSTAEAANLPPTDKQTYKINRRIQAQNRAPADFPGFIREGFDVRVVGDGYVIQPNGLIYKDYEEGMGSMPVEGQQVMFHYTGYNESSSEIDSSYRKGRPAETRLGIAGLIPGFEEGIRGMKVGGKRRVIVPPALGPPIGPSTFFSAKQCEVFDVELLAIKTCQRRQMMMFSDVVCE